MFVGGDGELLAKKVFRRAENSINLEAKERKIKEGLKNSDSNIFKRNFPQVIKNCIFQFQTVHF